MTATLSRQAAPQDSSRGLPARTLFGRETDPAWARPALWGTLLLAALLYTWNLSANGDANSYYSAAVYSGTQSWKAFFFGALDAGSYITVDKPPMALWVMSLSTRIFGYNTASLLLPQAIAGVATVGVLYTAVRRTFGHGAATIAALVLALTPMTVAINRDNNPDTFLVLLLTLAAWACLTAMRSGRLLPLLGSAFLIGCAFNTKMLQGYLVLPAFTGVYLLFAEGGFVRRLRNLAAAGVVLVVSSGWWMVIVDLIPASSRPYIGGSENNTVWDLVIGYNGLGRIFGENRGGGGGGGGGANFGGAAGAGRLFNSIVGGQISWLLPAAAIALVAGVLLIGRAPRPDARRAALLLWGGWLAVHYVIFSFAEGTFHPYYVTALAPAIGALIGAGSVLLWQAPKRLAWILPLSVAVTGGWAFTLLRRTPSWHPWVAWAVVAATVIAVVALLVVRFAPRSTRSLAIIAVVTTLVAGLAGPTAFAASAAASRVNGTNPTAGPSTGGGMGGPGGAPGGQRQGGGGAPPNMPSGGFGGGGASGGGTDGGGANGGFPGGGGGGGGPGGNVDSAMVQYLEKNQGNATWLVAVSSAQGAGSLILQTHKAVIAMGGFTGSDPAMTVAKLQSYVSSGKLKYIVLGGDNRGGNANSDVTAWVKAHGTVVNATEYGGTSSSSSSSTSTQVLYKLG